MSLSVRHAALALCIALAAASHSVRAQSSVGYGLITAVAAVMSVRRADIPDGKPLAAILRYAL